MVSYESTGTLVSTKKTADKAAQELDVTCTIPSGTSMDATVKQDTNSDGAADNTQTITLSDGTNTYNLTNFSSVSGSDYWVEFTLNSDSDGTTTPTGDSVTARVSFSRTATSHVGTIETNANAQLLVPMERTATSHVGTIETNANTRGLYWRIDGDYVIEVVEETRTWDKLKLDIKTDRTTVLNTLRPLDSHAEKVEVLDRADGGFVAVDRSDGKNTYEVIPINDRHPPRTDLNALVKEYNEKIIDQNGERYRVRLVLVPDSSRNTNSGHLEMPGFDDWRFDFHTGKISTSRVQRDVGGTGKRGTQSQQLTLILNGDQARVVEESAARLNAVHTREIPDGDNLVEDNSPNSRNTVTVTPPPGYALEFGGLNGGDYVEVPDDPTLDITGNITMAVTCTVPSDLDVDTNNNYRAVLGKGTPVGDYSVLFEETGAIDFTVHKGGIRENISGGTIPMDGTPFTVVCTHDTSTGESVIHLDGAQVASATVATGGIDTSTSSLFLSESGGSHQYLGTIDRVRVDARVWSASEVDDYNSGVPVDRSERRLELVLDKGSGSTAHDTSGNSNDGTITGTSWVKAETGTKDGFDAVPPGEYAVTDWTTSMISEDFQEVTLSLEGL